MIDRFVAACSADARIVAAFLGGSHARGEADRYSDVDLCVIARDEAYDDVVADRTTIVRSLGEPLFLEDFGLDGIVFFILADGTEGEIFFGREDRLDDLWVGPFRTLLDEAGILEGVTFPPEEAVPAEQLEELRRVLSWFWHELSHLIAAIGRGQPWWAYGQLEAMRALCVNLVRIEQGAQAGEEPYEKLDQAIATADLGSLGRTNVPLEPPALLRAAVDIVGFFRARAPRVAEAYGLTYPTELERLLCDRLDDVAGSQS